MRKVSPSRLIISRISVVALALVSVYYSLHTITMMWGPNGFFGFDIDGATAIVSDIAPRNANKGIHVGDRVDLAAMPFPERDHLYDYMLKPVGLEMTVRALHDGRWRTATFRVDEEIDPGAGGLFDMIAFGWGRKVVTLIFAAMGVVLVWNRPTPMLCGLAVFLIATHNYFVGPLTAPVPDALLILGYAIVAALAIPGLIVFAARFPDGRANGTTKFCDAAAALCFVVYFYFNVHDYIPLFTGRPISDLPDLTIFSAVAHLFLFITLVAKLRLKRRSRGAGFEWIVAGYGVGIVIGRAGLNVLFGYLNITSDWPYVAQVTLTLALPAAVGYSVIRHRAFGLGFIGNRAVIYALLTVAVVSTFFEGVWLAGSQVSSVFGIGSAMFVALLVGITFQAQHGRMVRLVDRLFMRQRYEAGLALDQIREAVRGSRNPRLLADEVASKLGLTSIAVFARMKDGGFVREAACGWPEGTAWHLLPDEALSRSLATSETVLALPEDDDDGVALPAARARPRVALTLRRANRVERAIFVGPYRNGSNLDRDAIRSLHGVFEDAALA